MKVVQAYKVKSQLFESKEKARNHEIKHKIKEILKERKYKFKSTNDFMYFFEDNILLFQEYINNQKE